MIDTTGGGVGAVGGGWESRRADELPRIRGWRGKMIERGGGAQRAAWLITIKATGKKTQGASVGEHRRAFHHEC